MMITTIYILTTIIFSSLKFYIVFSFSPKSVSTLAEAINKTPSNNHSNIILTDKSRTPYNTY